MLKLTEKDLDEFAEYINSGEIESDFRDGCEHDRHYILGLLEKFMDIADLCDETASKLIFKGGLEAMAKTGAPKADAPAADEKKAGE